MKVFFKQGHKIGIFFVLLTIVWLAWVYLQPAERLLNVQLLQLNFLEFSGMNWFSIVLAMIQSYIWGYLAFGMWLVASKLADLKK